LKFDQPHKSFKINELNNYSDFMNISQKEIFLYFMIYSIVFGKPKILHLHLSNRSKIFLSS